MPKLLIKTLLLLFTGIPLLHAQSSGQSRLKTFLTESKELEVYYPENFKVEEQFRIVLLSDTVSGTDILITSYTKEHNVSQKSLTDSLSHFLKKVFVTERVESDYAVYKSKFDHLIETRYQTTKRHWIWWGVAQKNRILFISADNKRPHTKEEVEIIRYIIAKLVIH